MKKIIMTIVLATSSLGFAQDSHLQDEADYLISVFENSDYAQCSQAVCKISKTYGNGECRASSPLVGVIAANLSSDGLEIVRQFRCVEQVTLEKIDETRPGIGRSN